MKQTKTTIHIFCGNTEFCFELKQEFVAWYDLDGMQSQSGKATLKINADRDVYAEFVDEKGIIHYGTIGDKENELLADNYPCEQNEKYIFYENPKTKDYYA